MIKHPVKTLVMSEVNKEKEQTDEPQDKIYELENCANEVQGMFKTYGLAWRHCAHKKEFNTTEVIRHGANPNLKPGHNMFRHEFMESHFVPPIRTHVDVKGPKGPIKLQKGVGLDKIGRNNLVKDMKKIQGYDHAETSLRRKQFAGGFKKRLHESSFHTDGVLFKTLRDKIGKGPAWSQTLGKHEHIIKGKFLPDDQTTDRYHNLYDLAEAKIYSILN